VAHDLQRKPERVERPLYFGTERVPVIGADTTQRLRSHGVERLAHGLLRLSQPVEQPGPTGRRFELGTGTGLLPAHHPRIDAVAAGDVLDDPGHGICCRTGAPVETVVRNLRERLG